MKWLKPFFFFLVAVLIVTVVLSLLMPTRQKIEHSITIQAPASVIYKQLTRLENFNKYSVWGRRDSAVQYTLTGTDGEVGARSEWTGNPDISGTGKIEISMLEENKIIKHNLTFTKPKKGKAESIFTLHETNGVTAVTWNFELATPRPWNIFNLFFSLDKEIGKDFEESLSVMKTAIENTNGVASSKSYDVQPMNFPSTSFATIRQQVTWADMPAFFAQHFPILYEEAAKANASPGTGAGLFYDWDEKNQQADIAAAIPVSPGSAFENPIIQVVTIPASKALFVNYYGAYDKLADAYNSIRSYLAKNNLEEKTPSIEQYITDPGKEKDTANWLTKIVFLVK